MSLSHLFTRHPASVGETYGEHMMVASRVGCRMMLGGFACLVHALVPFVFVTTGSRTVKRLHDEIIARAGQPPQPHV